MAEMAVRAGLLRDAVSDRAVNGNRPGRGDGDPWVIVILEGVRRGWYVLCKSPFFQQYQSL